jgi:hypothetical protein
MVVSPCTTFTLPEKVALLFLVAHFERRRLDLDWLIAVLRKALHRIWHAGHRALRHGVSRRDQRECRGRKTPREELHHLR